jgi:hypothetical protein
VQWPNWLKKFLKIENVLRPILWHPGALESESNSAEMLEKHKKVGKRMTWCKPADPNISLS